MDRVVFNPFSPLMLIFFFGLLALFLLAVIVFPILFLTAIGATFTRLGFSWWQALLILFLTLIGSFINIPVSTLEGRPGVPAYDRYAVMYGRLYRIPQQAQRTVLAINVGGALIPVAISLYLLYESVVISEGYHLIGADLLNLHRIAELGAPTASIGGAGTFDGIFLTGIIAALLA
jgi:uncharacterized membrane protein